MRQNLRLLSMRRQSKTRSYPIQEVTLPMRTQMFEVFKKYYDNVSFETFSSDLSEKSQVFIVWDLSTRRVVGFSTLKKFSYPFRKRSVSVYFSGDTIVEK